MTDSPLEPYRIPLKSLSVGEHTYRYRLDDGFFAAVEALDVKHGEVGAEVTVRKTTLAIEVDIVMQGAVEVVCDRCLEPMSVDVDVDEMVCVTFGTEYKEEDDHLIVVPEDEGIFDISWLLYEYVALSVPMIHTHPDGECDQAMIDIIDAHSAGSEDKEDKDEVDPRWAALKNILNN